MGDKASVLNKNVETTEPTGKLSTCEAQQNIYP